MSEAEHRAAASASRRPLVHRIPVRLRQYWKLLAAIVAAILGLVATLGDTVIRPYITSDIAVMTSDITENITGTVDLFDSSVPHNLAIDLTDAEYSDMINAYAKDGEKKWVNADITIDGLLITDVAVRLKGNSTLMGLRKNSDIRPPDGAGGGAPQGDAMNMVSATAEDPASLPLLISFDQNAEGRGYQGMTELSVRPGTPVLNEALALSLTAASGQPTQRYTYTTYTINGHTTTRLVLEHPDDLYADALFASDGYLYKADANSRLEFVGTDQSDYAGQFKQINAADSGNLQPLINFLRWLDGADDAEFDAHLSDWVDVESFARYLATQNLLVNADDMGGPGQNYYLWYDLHTEKLSVVSWDLNLAMQGDAATGPHDEVKISMPGGAAGDKAPPEGVPGGQGMPNFENQLKTRFLKSTAFTHIYDDAYWELYDRMYGAGHAHRVLDQIGAAIPVTDGLGAETRDAAVDSMHTWIDQRVTALDTVAAG
ncbi:CotH kinase family protein [Mycolicibacterium fluoranthenivorans]|jgi:spore coat protein CotH|uniref:CotH kinase family protein n=1 Tax=Mycolicibacterium fluoranthenivorans TaxID=258505 RepID=A0A7G8PDU4_9MYCO|nr:CotH kinase family protein [Mycolicibacterium fluoranthenivorans]QNJ92510.1 CotH kinase family protein [Mycolicibacterium fluoranthenivorans]